MKRNLRLTMNLVSVARCLPIITGVCLAITLSPEKAFAQGWGTPVFVDYPNSAGYTVNTRGTGAVLASELLLGSYILGQQLVVASGTYGLANFGTSGRTIVRGGATYYDAQGRPSIPNSGYTWTGITNSGAVFGAAASYSINNSTGVLTPVGSASVEVDDSGISGNPTENMPYGKLLASSPTPAMIGGFFTSVTGPNATIQGYGTNTSEGEIGAGLYFQNGSLAYASEAGGFLWRTTFAVTTTQAMFQQYDITGCECDAYLDCPNLSATADSGSGAGIASGAYAMLFGYSS